MGRELYQKLQSLGAEPPAAEEDAYLEELTSFLVSFDFMKLGQAVSRGQWEVAMMTLRRMEQKAKNLGLRSFGQPFAGLRQAILNKNVQQGKQIMASLTAKRVRLREAMRSVD